MLWKEVGNFHNHRLNDGSVVLKKQEHEFELMGELNCNAGVEQYLLQKFGFL